MNIQVLWVDDEYKEDFISFAEQEGIDIFHKKSAREGIDELKSKPNAYHAIILDAKGILEENDQTTGLDGLRVIRDYLITVNAHSYLPHFILTGQPDYQSNELFKQSFGSYFTKGKDEERLIAAIRDAVTNKNEYIIHKKYSHLFEATTRLLDTEIHSNLTQILLAINKMDSPFNDKLHFTQIRIILESLFRTAHTKGLLHDKCISKGKVLLTESSAFLAGTHKNYPEAKPHFPKIIAEAVQNILTITGAASHTSDPEIDKNIGLQEYRSKIKTPYLLYSLTFQILDIILWFDEYLKVNNDYKKNSSYWKLSK